MKIFSDLPEWYEIRIKRMYRKQASKVKQCPNYLSVNHLLKPCPRCNSSIKQTWEVTATARVVDRIYTLHKDDRWERFCLTALVRDRQLIQTGLEFPTPKLVYRSQTRIPQFYCPTTSSLIDCFESKEIMDEYSKYFVSTAYEKCRKHGLYYDRVVVSPDKVVTWHRQPRSKEVEDMIQRLLSL